MSRHDGGRPRRLAAGGIVLLAALGVAGAEAVRARAFTTADEGTHVASARFLKDGTGLYRNVEHPVLMKILAAPFLPARPSERPVDDTRAARAPFPILFGLLVLVSGFWALRRGGAAAGLAAAALVAVDPSLRGHGALVHSDVLVVLFLVAAGFSLDVATSGRRSSRSLVLAGVLYGFALLAKYSALPFLAVFAVAAALRLPRGTPATRRLLDTATHVVFPALAVLALGTELAFAGVPRERLREGAVTKWRELHKEGDPGAFFDHGPKGLATYALGLDYVRRDAEPGKRFNYLFGRVSGRGFLFYFPVALGVKLTTATLGALLAALGTLAALWAAARRRPNRRGRRERVADLAAGRAALPLALGAAYLAAAMASNLNIGVRHALPVVPLLIVGAAIGGASLMRARPRLFAVLAAAVVVASGAEAAARFGREISFGNLLAGGPRGLRRILTDSNVEWGQEQQLLYDRLRAGRGRAGYLAAFVDDTELRSIPSARPVFRADLPGFDEVVVSTFLLDLGRALGRCDETWPKFLYSRSWMTPLVEGLARRAVRVEPLGDAYVVMTLGPPGAALPVPR